MAELKNTSFSFCHRSYLLIHEWETLGSPSVSTFDCQAVRGTGCTSLWQKPEDVLVVLPAIQVYVVITAKLVILVNPTHMLVVLCERAWAVDCSRDTILFLTLDSFRNCRVWVGGQDHNRPTVLPHSHSQITILSCDTISFNPCFCRCFQCHWETLPVDGRVAQLYRTPLCRSRARLMLAISCCSKCAGRCCRAPLSGTSPLCCPGLSTHCPPSCIYIQCRHIQSRYWPSSIFWFLFWSASLAYIAWGVFVVLHNSVIKDGQS